MQGISGSFSLQTANEMAAHLSSRLFRNILRPGGEDSLLSEGETELDEESESSEGEEEEDDGDASDDSLPSLHSSTSELSDAHTGEVEVEEGEAEEVSREQAGVGDRNHEQDGDGALSDDISEDLDDFLDILLNGSGTSR